MPKPDFSATERLIHDIEREDLARRGRMEQILREEGRDDLVAEFRQNMRDVDTGVTRARNLWHTLTAAQRAALVGMQRTGNARLKRMDCSPMYGIDGPGVPLDRPVRLATLRKLAAHDLVDWDGGAFDPEAGAVLNEQGRFVLAKGRPAA